MSDTELESLRAQNAAMLDALVTCHRYFIQCALAWKANAGRLVNSDGQPYVAAKGLDALAESAANKIAALSATFPELAIAPRIVESDN